MYCEEKSTQVSTREGRGMAAIRALCAGVDQKNQRHKILTPQNYPRHGHTRTPKLIWNNFYSVIC